MFFSFVGMAEEVESFECICRNKNIEVTLFRQIGTV